MCEPRVPPACRQEPDKRIGCMCLCACLEPCCKRGQGFWLQAEAGHPWFACCLSDRATGGNGPADGGRFRLCRKMFFCVTSSVHLFTVYMRKRAGVWLEAAACWAGADGQPVSLPTVLSDCSCPTAPYLPCPLSKSLTLVTVGCALFEELAMYSKKPFCTWEAQ